MNTTSTGEFEYIGPTSTYHGHRARPSQRSWQNQGNNKRERSPSPTHTSKRSKSQKPPSQTSIFGSLDPLKDDSKITNRTKQISYGKNTLSYDRYLESTPIETRKLSDPWTPDAKADIPNRRWKGMVGEWKRRLHVWDPQGYESKEKVKEKKERKEEKGVVDPTLEFEREEEKEEIGEDLYEENENELPKFEEFEEDSDDDLL
ncbi:hypothetical protein TL16_g06553 [Triparma laevis f. inornata]|uniref:Histone RNA hairpin-binding protein RNA-binding domain-containing protein n=1 Tax=Triparma laevis f. inornata TaxID=1714386 RepID=A0A9W7AQE8_9STRA|nr:hypothetical protein TL16_g06553 [Triparma laevis f. inornata]